MYLRNKHCVGHTCTAEVQKGHERLVFEHSATGSTVHLHFILCEVEFEVLLQVLLSIV